MPEVEVNGVRLNYIIEGRGDPVLWISGLGMDHRAWWKQIPVFRDRFTCVLFDNRDAGRSGRAAKLYAIADMATDACQVLNALAMPKAHVVGVSMGGAIAQEMAIRYPEKVGKLALLSTYHQGDPRGTMNMESWQVLRRRLSPEEYYKAIMPWIFTYRDFLVPGLVETHLTRAMENPDLPPPEAYARQSAATAQFDSAGRLSEIKAPTLILSGDDDILTPLRFAHALHKGIPGSQLMIVPGAGHAMIWTHAAQVNATLLGFFLDGGGEGQL
ncbi:MAG: alpha/beta fold hydrolase [Chloroflexi bacterium]|nr:alpha/beta fold hydrolase [Chloroflexota bacterium]